MSNRPSHADYITAHLGSKTFGKERNKLSPGFKTIFTGCVLLLLAGCAGKIQVPVPSPSRTIPPPVTIPTPPETQPEEESVPVPPEETETPPQPPTPRALASLELSRQAQLLIDAGKPDEAIRILEQAVNLHPGSGESYYYLAEAWRRKGNLSQALEYNNLAAIRFKDNPEWMARIALQKRRIDRNR